MELMNPLSRKTRICVLCTSRASHHNRKCHSWLSTKLKNFGQFLAHPPLNITLGVPEGGHPPLFCRGGREHSPPSILGLMIFMDYSDGIWHSGLHMHTDGV